MTIRRLRYYISNETDPYRNLALEEYLLHNVTEDECILYLWQNEKTVVIGINQNPWKECKVKELNEDGGRLVRRLSGGGAVYHDLGNLNFTFIMTKDNYDVERQLEVIIKAVNSLGIRAVKSGRNDITVDGRKFSGNAFYSIGGKCYHHGTILVDVDMPSLSKYLNVSKTKLISKGVDSVRKRVTNLKEYRPELSMDMLKNELLQAFRKTYGLELARIEDAEFSQDTIKAGIEKFSSWEWNFGRKIEFSDSLERRFDWGDIELQMVVESGIIKDCRVYSDALDTEIFEILPKLLIGCRFSAGEMEEVLREIDAEDNKIRMIEDIITLIREEI
ncbi:MAG TPA: lipoate--protein ligase [Clostridiales bacterium]|jgi:lipoate-protein ligase A|nr:lipoate--protein ligase [Clostridiales bacterium]